ncbi:hypothetical protein FACS189416_4520 [Bacteroidia bacterium]|nr:hypothetical protein FACS189416_4520 [Bacteroidia bacterium]
MKKNLLSLSMLAIALITSSCSNDIDDGQTLAAGSSGQAITFKPWANKQLRSATQAKDVTDFAVLATDTTRSTGVGVLIDGALVTGSNASGWTYSPPAFWPETATVNFFAYSPTAAPGVTGGTIALVGQDDANPNEPTIEYEMSAQLSDQRDLLVARRSSTFAQDGAGGVLLNFRHALSRVLFEAKSESGMQFIVSSIKLKNVKNKATLDLNAVPKDTDPFPYPTDNATIDTVGYQVHWEPDVASTVVDLEANLTNTTVAGDGNWHYVVADDDALYVIPQENLASNLTKATPVGIGDPDPSNLFYIEITYREDGAGAVNKTYAVPVPAIVGDAYASSIAFEMERQYTFQFELFGKKPIEFKSVKVSAYKDVAQEELLRLHWAGSNIYWDGAKLTFADSDDKSKEQYQGVFFKWGSLVGMSSAGTNAAWPRITYYPTNPGVDDGWTSDPTKYATYANIPYINDAPAPYGLDNPYLTTITNDAATGADTIKALKGDICVYLTKVGAAPKGKRWRMPTIAEFNAEDHYTKSGGFTQIFNQNEDGTTPISSGWRRNNLNTPYFPASGFRVGATGVLNTPGTGGDYWSSSPNSVSYGYNLYFTSGSLNVVWVGGGAVMYGFTVRCVAE